MYKNGGGVCRFFWIERMGFCMECSEKAGLYNRLFIIYFNYGLGGRTAKSPRREPLPGHCLQSPCTLPWTDAQVTFPSAVTLPITFPQVTSPSEVTEPATLPQ